MSPKLDRGRENNLGGYKYLKQTFFIIIFYLR